MECKALQNQIVINNVGGSRNGLIKPCCSFNIFDPVSEDNIYNLSIDEARDKLNAINLNTKPESCKRCFIEEDLGIESNRLLYNNQFTGGQKIESLQVAMDGVCNMACITCRPALSSTWNKIAKTSTIAQNEFYKFTNDGNKKYIETIKKRLDATDLSNLKYVRIGGGEPLYSKNSIDFITNLKNKQNITLFVTTNGSIYPDQKLLDCFKEFNKVIIDFSIDGLDRLGSFMRQEVKWEVINSNIEKFLNFRDHNNIELTTHGTITAINFNVLDDIVEYSNERNMSSTFTLLHRPSYLYVALLPLNFRKMVFSTFKHQREKFRSISNMPQQDGIKKLHEYILYIESQFGTKLKDANEEVYDIIYTNVS